MSKKPKWLWVAVLSRTRFVKSLKPGMRELFQYYAALSQDAKMPPVEIVAKYLPTIVANRVKADKAKPPGYSLPRPMPKTVALTHKILSRTTGDGFDTTRHKTRSGLDREAEYDSHNPLGYKPETEMRFDTADERREKRRQELREDGDDSSCLRGTSNQNGADETAKKSKNWNFNPPIGAFFNGARACLS